MAGADRRMPRSRAHHVPRVPRRKSAAAEGAAAVAIGIAVSRRRRKVPRRPKRRLPLASRVHLAEKRGNVPRKQQKGRSHRPKADLTANAAFAGGAEEAAEAAEAARLQLHRSERQLDASGIAFAGTECGRFIRMYRAEHSANPSHRMQ